MCHHYSLMFKSLKCITALYLVILSKGLFADDTAFGGEGALPIPISQPDIKMVNEVIIITGKNLNNLNMNGSWHFNCTFNFKNSLNKALKVDMGFPFPVNDGMGGVALPAGQRTGVGKALVYNFQLQIDGKNVSSHKEKIAPNQAKGLNYDEAYLWNTLFPALATVIIHHDYDTGATYDVMGYHWVAYVLKTGGLWQDKTIGHAQLEVIPNTPTRLCSELVPNKEYLNTTPSGMHIVGTGYNRKYVWDLPNLQPTEDLSLCLFTGKSYIRYSIVYAWINTQDAVKKLAQLSGSELRILRNTVFAQYGRQFKSEDLQHYFNNQWWYEVDPNYSDVSLSPEDKQLLGMINEVNH